MNIATELHKHRQQVSTDRKREYQQLLEAAARDEPLDVAAADQLLAKLGIETSEFETAVSERRDRRQLQQQLRETGPQLQRQLDDADKQAFLDDLGSGFFVLRVGITGCEPGPGFHQDLEPRLRIPRDRCWDHSDPLFTRKRLPGNCELHGCRSLQ